jgi:glutamate dehydrogenase (NAD(P)+)
MGGSQGREEATGFGGVEILKQTAKAAKLKKGATIALQGIGNVGSFFAELASQAGFRVVAIADSKSGIYNPKGLDIRKVLAHKKAMGDLKNYPGVLTVSNEKLLELPVDVLVPAALENQLHKNNAKRMKAKVILEMANGPTTPEADAIFHKRGIWVIPDVLSNSGGVATSYLEWTQNLSGYYWSKPEVLKRLTEYMTAAWRDVLAVRSRHGTDFRTAAFILAVTRITHAMQDRGI